MLLGCATIVLSSLLGVLAHEPTRDPSSYLHKIELFLSVIVPVLTALVAFLRFDERSAMHHNAAAKFAALKRKLQIHYTECISKGCSADNLETLTEVCKVWNELTVQSPALYKSDWPEIELYDAYLRRLRAEAEGSCTVGNQDLPASRLDGRPSTHRATGNGPALVQSAV
jgi:hypothetical protein